MSLLLLALLLGWDASGLDMEVANLFGGVHGFPWRDHWLLDDVLHGGGRRVSWLFALAWQGWPLAWGSRCAARIS